jgi:hypothetical protein
MLSSLNYSVYMYQYVSICSYPLSVPATDYTLKHTATITHTTGICCNVTLQVMDLLGTTAVASHKARDLLGDDDADINYSQRIRPQTSGAGHSLSSHMPHMPHLPHMSLHHGANSAHAHLS